jgi:2-oxoacid dehydrogenases acyltransferase (catalytic domain)
MPFGASETAEREPTLPQANFNRLRLIWSQLLDQLKMPPAPGRIVIYPRIRNFVRDVLAEGRRKNIAHLTFEADIGPMRERLAEHRRRSAELVSITSYVAKSFACAIEEDKRMQAYRLGKSRLVLFDDVDLVFMIEREWENEPIPVFSIVRAAQRKATHEIHRELQMAKEAPLGTDGPMNALEMQFFLLPSFLRRVLWFFVRRNPYWFKDVAGTALVSSMGMFTSGASVGVPITPMTLSLCIGSIEKKLALLDGQVIEREVLHLNISIDHDIIDGAPLVRFAERFKKILLDGRALPASTAEPQKIIPALGRMSAGAVGSRHRASGDLGSRDRDCAGQRWSGRLSP